MSTKQQANKSSLTLRGFGGVDGRSCQTDPPTARRLVNLFVREDGSLEKRSGYRPLIDLGESIRALWTGRVGGAFTGYLLLGRYLYSLDFSSLERTLLGEVATDTGNACIFFYRGELYVLDATGFYLLREGSLIRPVGYVPLVGKDWAQGEIGDVFEPRNLLCPHARISYLITDPPTIFLCADGRIASVEAVYLNGILLDSDRYTLDRDFNTVNLPGLQAGDRVVVHLTFESDYTTLLSELYGSTQVTLFGDAGCDRLFCWGGGQGSTVYCTSFVKDAQLRESRKHYPNSGPLYFPLGFSFGVGGGHARITGAVRHHDRLLLMTESETWTVSSGSSGLSSAPTVCVNPSLGCEQSLGVTLAGNDPVSIGQGGIWQWTGDTDELNHQNAHCISGEIEGEFFPRELAEACLYYHRRDDSLWVLIPSREEAWVRSARGCWSRYSGIRGDRLLELDGKVGLLRGSQLFVFEPDRFTDRESNGFEYGIVGSYESNLLDFGTDRKKKLASVTLQGDLGGGTADFSFEGNGISPATHSFSEPRHNEHSILRARVHTDHFRCGRVKLTLQGNAGQVIHSLSLHLCKS